MSTTTLADCVEALEHARATGAARQREHAAHLWRRHRAELAPAATSPADRLLVAHLEALTSLADADEGQIAVAEAMAVADVLQDSGDVAGAVLHILACLRRQVPAEIDEQQAATFVAQADRLVAETQRGCQGPEVAAVRYAVTALLQGVAMARLRAVPDAGPDDPVLEAVERRCRRGVEQALPLVEAAGTEELDAMQRAAWAMLLRERAALAEGQEHVDTLRQAMALLPEGFRVGERAAVGLALAESLEFVGAEQEVAFLAEQAIEDARRAGLWSVAGAAHALGARIALRGGDLAAAIAEQERAAAAHAEAGDVLQASRAYHALASMVQQAGHPEAAATLADEALMALEEHLHEEGADGTRAPSPAAVRTATDLATLAARCQETRGLPEEAAALARHAVAWARHGDDPTELFDALELVGDTTPDDDEAVAAYDEAVALAPGAEAWSATLWARRERARRLARARGLPTARAALDEVRRDLAAVRDDDAAPQGRRTEARRELLRLDEHEADMMAEFGDPAGALALAEGLDAAFRALGDERGARRSALVLSRVLLARDDPRRAVEVLETAAEQARTAGTPDEVLCLGGAMARTLEQLGRHQESERAWTRYTVDADLVTGPAVGGGTDPAAAAGLG